MISQSNTILDKCFRPSSITLFQPALLFPSGVDRRLAVSHCVSHFPPGGLHFTQWRRNWAFPLLRHCLAHSPLPVNPRGKAKQQNSCFVAFPPRRLLGGASVEKQKNYSCSSLGKMGFPGHQLGGVRKLLFTKQLFPLFRNPHLGNLTHIFKLDHQWKCLHSVHIISAS